MINTFSIDIVIQRVCVKKYNTKKYIIYLHRILNENKTIRY